MLERCGQETTQTWRPSAPSSNIASTTIARCAADALRHAEAISRREGLRFTTQRRAGAGGAARRATSRPRAYDVIDRLAEHGRRLAPISVYRALDFLVENGFAHRIESRNAYVACDRGADCDAEATLFLICDNCGAVGEASSDALGRVVAEARPRRLPPAPPVLEIRGLCASCRAA